MKQLVADHLMALHKIHNPLTPEQVVEDAKRPDSPLHDLFDWDLQRAAALHWLDTARALIRSVRVTIVNEDRVLKAPYFVRDPTQPVNVQGYVSAASLRSEHDLAREVVAQECARASAAFQRAQIVAAAVGVEADLKTLIEATSDLRSKISA